MAGRGVGGMFAGTVAAGTGRESTDQIDLGEEFEVVAGAHRAGLHEVLPGGVAEAGAHEDVEDVVYERLSFPQAHVLMIRQRAGQVRVTAVVVLPAVGEEVVRVGVASGADDVVDGRSERVETVPVEGVVDDRRHGSKRGKRAPHPVRRREMRAVERTRLAGVETFGQVVCVPQVQVADLRSFNGGDAEEVTGRDGEAAGVSGRYERFRGLRSADSGLLIRGRVGLGESVDRVADDRGDTFAFIGVGRTRMSGRRQFHVVRACSTRPTDVGTSDDSGCTRRRNDTTAARVGSPSRRCGRGCSG